MNLISKKLAVWSLSALALLATSQSYASVTYETPAGSSMSGVSVGGEATFTLVGDVLTIQLSSLVANPISDGSLLSGLEFDVTGGTSATLNSSSGITTTIATGGSYTPSSSPQSLSKWTLASSSGTMINLSAFGHGAPYDMIIGPDSQGGFSGAGKYNNANSSIYNHQPEVLGTATFCITVDGLSSLSQISDVSFEFSTTSGCWVGGKKVNTPNPVPEPTTIISGFLILVPLSIQLLRKAWQQKQPAPVKVTKQS